jgi:hypothetical protein
MVNDGIIINSFLEDSFPLTGIARWEPTCNLLVMRYDTLRKFVKSMRTSKREATKMVLLHELAHRWWTSTQVFQDLFEWNAVCGSVISRYDTYFRMNEPEYVKALFLSHGLAVRRLRTECRTFLEATALYAVRLFYIRTKKPQFQRLIESTHTPNKETIKLYGDMNWISDTFGERILDKIIKLSLFSRKHQDLDCFFELPSVRNPNTRFRFFNNVLRMAHDQGVSWSKLVTIEDQVISHLNPDCMERQLWDDLLLLPKLMRSKAVVHERKPTTQLDKLTRLFMLNRRRRLRYAFILGILRDKMALLPFQHHTKSDYALMRIHVNLCQLTFDLIQRNEPRCFFERIGDCPRSCLSCFHYLDLRHARQMQLLLQSTDTPLIDEAWNKLTKVEKL